MMIEYQSGGTVAGTCSLPRADSDAATPDASETHWHYDDPRLGLVTVTQARIMNHDRSNRPHYSLIPNSRRQFHGPGNQ
jgi:hypothetical protein